MDAAVAPVSAAGPSSARFAVQAYDAREEGNVSHAVIWNFLGSWRVLQCRQCAGYRLCVPNAI